MQRILILCIDNLILVKLSDRYVNNLVIYYEYSVRKIIVVTNSSRLHLYLFSVCGIIDAAFYCILIDMLAIHIVYAFYVFYNIYVRVQIYVYVTVTSNVIRILSVACLFHFIPSVTNLRSISKHLHTRNIYLNLFHIFSLPILYYFPFPLRTVISFY